MNKICRESFYALIKKQTLHWQLIDAGKVVDEETKQKPLKKFLQKKS